MISELSFIRTYNSFWKSIFPGGEDYIRLINSTLGESFAKQIDFKDPPFRRALINNVSFSFFELIINKNLTIWEFEELTDTSDLLIKSIATEIKILSNLRFGNMLLPELIGNEILTIKIIVKRLVGQYRFKAQLVLRPAFLGCGILFEANGDIYYDSTLVEIKAGQRSFSILDLRQLYTYAAMNHLNKEYEIIEIELCNPRTGFLWREYIDIVSENISGYSTIEIFKEIITFISEDNRSL